MVFFNYALRKLNAKIVYYGPGLCGKTTNLQWIHDNFEGGDKGKMVSLATEGDRTIFFDLLPLDIGTIRGMDVTLQLYTVPGQVHYNSTRQLVLRGADGVVFVADSQRAMQSSNADSLINLNENLGLQGVSLAEFPHVIQFNKRDLSELMAVEEMDTALNRFDAPFFEAVAVEGIGVQESLEGIVRLVMKSLKDRYEARGLGAQSSGLRPAGAAGPWSAPGAGGPSPPSGVRPLGAVEAPTIPEAHRGDGSDSEKAPGTSAFGNQPASFEEVDTQTGVLVPPGPVQEVDAAGTEPADRLPTGPGKSFKTVDENAGVAQYDTADVDESQDPVPDDGGAPLKETAVEREDVADADVAGSGVLDSPEGEEGDLSTDQPENAVSDPVPGDGVEDLVASVLGSQEMGGPAFDESAGRGVDVPESVDQPEEIMVETTPDEIVRPFPRPSTLAPVVFDDGDPFSETEWDHSDVESPFSTAFAVADDEDQPPVSVSAGDNSLALKLTGTGAIVESGQVRALDIEVPVPGDWVGNRRVTLQLRLTLLPITEDENDGTIGPA